LDKSHHNDTSKSKIDDQASQHSKSRLKESRSY
jgi:hypothetical protein